ncbi:MAG: hypothetical protein LBT30_06325 [Clostridiales bacterium]|jgi:hypothetical protein|nr:hypothetical protein [Clostridiales bacterium]
MPHITGKELAALSDLLNFEQAAYKNCASAGQNITDKKVKQMLRTTGECHKKRFDDLMSFLSKE